MNSRRAGLQQQPLESSRNCNKSGEQRIREGGPEVTHDTEYFHRRAAEARAAACSKDEPERVEIAGELALAYAALARRRAAALAAAEERPAITLEQPA
jgi:hypothetical protein